MPIDNDLTPPEIRNLIARQIQETLDKSKGKQDFNRIYGMPDEMKEKTVTLEMEAAFERAWFDNVAVLVEVSKETAWEWFKLGYKAHQSLLGV